MTFCRDHVSRQQTCQMLFNLYSGALRFGTNHAIKRASLVIQLLRPRSKETSEEPFDLSRFDTVPHNFDLPISTARISSFPAFQRAKSPVW